MNPKILQLAVSFAMIAAGIVPMIYWARSRKVEISAFLLGTLAWIVTVTIKFAIAIPLNQPFARMLAESLSSTSGSIVYDAYIGLLTSITECGLLFLAIRFSSLKKYQFNQIIAFGIAFGAIEAILLGIRWGIGVGLTDASELARLPVMYSKILERASTLLLHTLSCTLIFYSIISKRPHLFWIAFAAKGIVDGMASRLIYSQAARSVSFDLGLYVSLFALGLLSSIGLWWISRNRDAWTNGEIAERPEPLIDSVVP